MYGSQQTYTVLANGQLLRAPKLRADDHRLPERQPGPARRGRRTSTTGSRATRPARAGIRASAPIYLAIQKQPGTNVVAVVDAVKKLLPTFREQLPAAVSLDIRTDRSVAIRESIHDVKFTLMLTVVLVVMVIFLFLRNVSATIIPSLALPASDHRDLRGDVPARLQPRQHVADGADAVASASSSTTRS